MSLVCRCLAALPVKILTQGPLFQTPSLVSIRNKFTKSRIPNVIFEERSKEHDKYGGDPNQPHKLHLVMRVKSTKRRPYWEKKLIKDLGLEKGLTHVVHKNTPAVNNLLKYVKHLVSIQPLSTPYGLPAEEDMADSYVNSKGELIVQRLLKPIEPKAIES